jgi:hypothetical protein
MKELVTIIALILVCSLQAGCSSDQGQVGISKISGGLEAGRVGAVAIELENNISFMPPPSGILSFEGSCLDVVARLQSNDSRVSVISGPMFAGSIAPGENKSLEFMASADQDIDAGTYPMELDLSYSRLSDVKSIGSMPDIHFEYDNVDETLPLEVNVSIGPRIGLQVDDSAAPGLGSELSFIFTNTGDEPANSLQAQLSPQYPFRPLSGVTGLGTLEPGGSKSVGLSVFTENGTKEGYYAIPCRIGYQSDNLQRSEEISGIVKVKARSWSSIAIPAAAAAFLIAAVIVAGMRIRRRKRPRRRKI